MISQDELNKKKDNKLSNPDKKISIESPYKFKDGETRAEQMARVGKLPTANKINLTENQIRYAMENTYSNLQASRFLGVAKDTWARYAKQYIDEKTGKSLYEIQKAKWRDKKNKEDIKRRYNYSRRNGFTAKKTPIEEILQGKHPKYSRPRLKQRLFVEGYMDECCQRCGFAERRVTDFTVPLYLCYKDVDKTNHHIDNLEILCFNCRYLYYGDTTWYNSDMKGYRD